MGLTAQMVSNEKASEANRSLVLSNKRSKPLFFQPKLTVGPANDAFEQEADAVADKVMRMSDHEKIQPAISRLGIQRKCAACEEEEHAQRKEFDAGQQSAEAPSIVSAAINSGGAPLESGAKAFMENRFGYDFSNVKIHTDTVATKSAQSINALAYTSGNSIVFNEGQYSPGTASGKRLLAHELTHVVQQSGSQPHAIQRMSLHLFDSTDNFGRRGGYAVHYCEDYSYLDGQCNKDLPGKLHAGIDSITQVPGQVSAFKSLGNSINEVVFHTHGAPGYVHLPNGGMNSTNISIIASIGSQLDADSTIDFKGCNVAEGTVGETFLQNVANTVLSVGGGRVRGTDSITFSVPGIGQRRPIWSSRPTACITAGSTAHMC